MKIFFFLIFFFQIVYSENQIEHGFLQYNPCNCKIENQLVDSPFQVTIGVLKKNSNIDSIDKICSGIIINSNWILAPASCVEKDYLKDKKVIVSTSPNDDLYEHLLFKNRDYLYTAKKIYRHNLYVENKNYTEHYLYNFAFIYLSDYIFNSEKSLQPACFYNSLQKRQFYDEIKIMYGWGVRKPLFTDKKGNLLDGQKNYNRYYSKINFTNSVKYFTKSHKKRLRDFCVKSDLLCLGSENPTCLGDVGSPLFLVKDSNYFVIGLANSAPPFKYYHEEKDAICVPGTPSFFTRMELIIEMMDSLIGKNYYCQVNLTGLFFTKIEPKAIIKNDESNYYCNCSCLGMFKNTFQSSTFDEEYKGTKIANGFFSFNRMVPVFYHSNENDKISSEFACLATILNPQFVISTASCLSRGNNKNYFIVKDTYLFEQGTYEEKISATLDIEEISFHPNYFAYSNILSFNVVILKLTNYLFFFNKKKPNLVPVCLPDINVYSKSKNNFYILPSEVYNNIDNPITVFRKQPKSFFISNDNCTISICLKHNQNKKINVDGTPLFQFNKDHIELVGIFTKKFTEKKTLSYFINVLKLNNWIKSTIGDFAFCEKKEAKNFLEKKYCDCENIFKGINTDVPYVVILIHYIVDEPLSIPRVFCKGILMNEYWFLTTSKCLMKPGREVKDIYISLIKDISLSIRQFNLLMSLELIKKVSYAVNHPDYLKKPIYNDIALVKLENGVVLDENSKQQLACFYERLSYKDNEDETLIIDGHPPEIYLKASDKNASKTLLIDCDNKNIMCLEMKDYFCEIDEGNAVVLIKENYAIAIGLILSRFTSYFESKCTFSENILVISISSKIDWINSVIGKESYCKTHLKMNAKLCQCKDNNHTTIALRKTSNDFTYLCKGFIVNSYYIITAGSCLLEHAFENDASHLYVIPGFNLEVKNSDNNNIKITDDKKVYLAEKVILNSYLKNLENVDDKARYDVALIKLRQKLELGESTSFYPACFGKINKDLEITKIFTLFKNSLSYLHFNKNDIRDEKCYYENILCVKSSSEFCKNDQGKPIGYEMNDKIKRLGFLLNPKYNSNEQKECFVPNYLSIFLIGSNNKWLRNEVDSEGICIIEEEEEEEEIENYCKCDYDNLLDIKKLNGNLTTSSKSFNFVAQIYTTNKNDLPKNACSLTLLGSGLILNAFWIITTNFLGLSYVNLDNILISNGFESITNDCNYQGPMPKMFKIDFIIASMLLDGPLLIKLKTPIQLGKETGTYPACITEMVKGSNIQKFSLGFGFDSESIDKIETTKIPFINSNYLKYLKAINDFKEVQTTECSNLQICLKSESRIKFLDMGGPIVQVKNNKIEVIALLTPEVKATYFKEYASQEMGKFINLNYFKEWILAETKETNFCFNEKFIKLD